MRNFKKLFLLLFLTSLSTTIFGMRHVEWQSDFEFAQALAVRELSTTETLELSQVLEALSLAFAMQDLQEQLKKQETELQVIEEPQLVAGKEEPKPKKKKRKKKKRGKAPQAVSAPKDPRFEHFELLVKANKIRQIKALLNDGFNVNCINEKDETPLHRAILCSACEEIIIELLERGADVNARELQGWTPLHFAARNGNLAIVKILLERGAEINELTCCEWSALYLAVSGGYEFLVQELIGAKAEVNTVDIYGMTPLHEATKVACYNKKTKSYNNAIIRRLLLAGANIDAEMGKDKLKPIELLNDDNIEGQKLFIAQRLLNNGLDINHQDNDGQTQLHKALKDDLLELTYFLICRGAKWDIADCTGKTALQYADPRTKAGSVLIALTIVQKKK